MKYEDKFGYKFPIKLKIQFFWWIIRDGFKERKTFPVIWFGG